MVPGTPEVIQTLKEAREATESALLTLHDLIEAETVLMHRRGRPPIRKI